MLSLPHGGAADRRGSIVSAAATLGQAYLVHAILSLADFNGTDFSRAELSAANLARTDLGGRT